MLFLTRRYSNKYGFHVHVTAQASSGNVIVIKLFIRHLLCDYIEPSLLSVRKNILLLTRSGIRFRHCFFSDLRISKTVLNTSAQHSLGYLSNISVDIRDCFGHQQCSQLRVSREKRGLFLGSASNVF